MPTPDCRSGGEKKVERAGQAEEDWGHDQDEREANSAAFWMLCRSGEAFDTAQMDVVVQKNRQPFSIVTPKGWRRVSPIQIEQSRNPSHGTPGQRRDSVNRSVGEMFFNLATWLALKRSIEKSSGAPAPPF